MTRCPDDDYDDDPYVPRSLARRPALPLETALGGVRGVVTPLELSAVAASAMALIGLPPSFLARIFRTVRRREVVADARAAHEAMVHLRAFNAEFIGMQRDTVEHIGSVLRIFADMDTLVQNHQTEVAAAAEPILTSIEASQESRRRRKGVRQRADKVLTGGGGPTSGVDDDMWSPNDEASNRARAVTIQGINQVDGETFDSPYVAFAALAYLKRLQDGESPEAARHAAFRDVREMLRTTKFTAKETESFVATIMELGASVRKRADAKTSIGSMVDGIKGKRS